MKCVPKSPVDNELVLVRVMAWCLQGNKLLPEPMLANIYVAIRRHEIRQPVITGTDAGQNPRVKTPTHIAI